MLAVIAFTSQCKGVCVCAGTLYHYVSNIEDKVTICFRIDRGGKLLNKKRTEVDKGREVC